MTAWPLPRMVGLCGPRRAGKDTIAEMLSATDAYHSRGDAIPTLGDYRHPNASRTRAVSDHLS